MNQCAIENYVINVQADMKFELKKLDEGYLLNYII